MRWKFHRAGTADDVAVFLESLQLEQVMLVKIVVPYERILWVFYPEDMD